MSARPIVYFVCTGNAARSVMAVSMLRSLTDEYEVRGGGTHSIEGRPMSQRTRAALARHGLADPHHRSHQLTASDVGEADVLVVMEPDHVEWVRRHHPEGASKTVTLRRLVTELPAPVDRRHRDDLASRVSALALDRMEVQGWETVEDPAAGEQPEFDRCADELMELVTALRQALG